MTADLQTIFTQQRTDSLSASALDAIMATRIDVSCRRRGIDPTAALVQRLGSEDRARRAHHMVEVVGAAWPEAFALSPPCCHRLSHDEALLGGLIEAAETGNRRWFDTISRDLLNDEARDALWSQIGLSTGRDSMPQGR